MDWSWFAATVLLLVALILALRHLDREQERRRRVERLCCRLIRESERVPR